MQGLPDLNLEYLDNCTTPYSFLVVPGNAEAQGALCCDRAGHYPIQCAQLRKAVHSASRILQMLLVTLEWYPDV